uniref:BZIP domain-containing protein n=1 Tax=Pinguiococcus pyrenoidosus TaxID=172671 RepID=A0A7R9U576_9STRA|mmetsp:Transcript_14542/g.54933  ORF Transcript_14542/g.54933 Transcript_14542/m.54933 type:complete len:849 (+) Transcript_14542:95-2641(+)
MVQVRQTMESKSRTPGPPTAQGSDASAEEDHQRFGAFFQKFNSFLPFSSPATPPTDGDNPQDEGEDPNRREGRAVQEPYHAGHPMGRPQTSSSQLKPASDPMSGGLADILRVNSLTNHPETDALQELDHIYGSHEAVDGHHSIGLDLGGEGSGDTTPLGMLFASGSGSGSGPNSQLQNASSAQSLDDGHQQSGGAANPRTKRHAPVGMWKTPPQILYTASKSGKPDSSHQAPAAQPAPVFVPAGAAVMQGLGSYNTGMAYSFPPVNPGYLLVPGHGNLPMNMMAGAHPATEAATGIKQDPPTDFKVTPSGRLASQEHRRRSNEAPGAAGMVDPLEVGDFSKGYWGSNGALATAWGEQMKRTHDNRESIGSRSNSHSSLSSGPRVKPEPSKYRSDLDSDVLARGGLRAVAVPGFGSMPMDKRGTADDAQLSAGSTADDYHRVHEQENERRRRRLARNRASARLRRQRKKTLVEAYEQEVTVLESAMQRLKAHQWGGGGRLRASAKDYLQAMKAKGSMEGAVGLTVGSGGSYGGQHSVLSLSTALALACDKSPKTKDVREVAAEWRQILFRLVSFMDTMLNELGSVALLPKLLRAQEGSDPEGLLSEMRSTDEPMYMELRALFDDLAQDARQRILEGEDGVRRQLTRLFLVRKAIIVAAVTPTLTLARMHEVMSHFERILHAPQRSRYLHWCEFHRGHIMRVLAQENWCFVTPASRRLLHVATRRIATQFPSGYAGLAMSPPTPPGPNAPITVSKSPDKEAKGADAADRVKPDPLPNEDAFGPQMMLMDAAGSPVPIQLAVLQGAPMTFQFEDAIALQFAGSNEGGSDKSPTIAEAAAAAAAAAARGESE